MLRVACVPSTHPYVAQVLPDVAPATYPTLPGTPAGSALGSITRLPDPVPDGAEPTAGVWWPARVLDPAWVREHRDELDLVHVHFGFESRTADQLGAWADTLDELGLPLVLTVHDLQNPHLSDQGAHVAALDVLVPRAAAVLTLTATAAAEIRNRWGRRAQVVAHPQVAPAIVDSPRGPGRRVGLHLGALRAGADPTPWLPALVAACDALGCELDVIGNDELLDGPDERRSAILDRVREAVGDRLRLVPRLDDEGLHAWVGSLDVVALPHRHGTHSGWLELCWDLATSVLAAPVGHLAGQHDDPGFLAVHDGTGADLRPALQALLDARGPGCPWGDATVRAARRDEVLADVRRAHEEVYQAVSAMRGGRGECARGASTREPEQSR